MLKKHVNRPGKRSGKKGDKQAGQGGKSQMVITGAIQDIIIPIAEDLTTMVMVMAMVIHTGMDLRIDTGFIIVTDIIMAGIIMSGLGVVNVWNVMAHAELVFWGEKKPFVFHL